MKLLFASDSFKGSLSSHQTIELLTKAAKDVFGKCQCEGFEVADGGEGTVDAVVKAVDGEKVTVSVHGPQMEVVNASYGGIEKKKAILEMATASGLLLVPLEKQNPLYATSYGTGEMIKDAMRRGFRDIFIAIGGSATNDGGIGAMKALGIKFLDLNGNELEGFGKDLERIVSIDDSGLDPIVQETHFTVMCDVTNPLCGPNGATYTFGPQKGGDPAILDRLEKGMQNYRKCLLEKYGIDADKVNGTGAAGGLGAALLIFLHGELKSGIETVLDLIHFDEHLQDTDLVVTGEGRTDWQSCFGKVIQGVGKRCKESGVPAIALCGSIGEGAEDIYKYGIETLMTTVDGPMSLSAAIKNAEELYYKGAVRLFRAIKVGMKIKC
jgi:glycerate kinase